MENEDKYIPLPNYYIGILNKLDREKIEEQLITKISNGSSLKKKFGAHFEHYVLLLIDYLIIITCSKNIEIDDVEADNIWKNTFAKTNYKFAKQKGLSEDYTKDKLKLLYDELRSNLNSEISYQETLRVLDDEIWYARKRISDYPLPEIKTSNAMLILTEPYYFFKPLINSRNK